MPLLIGSMTILLFRSPVYARGDEPSPEFLQDQWRDSIRVANLFFNRNDGYFCMESHITDPEGLI